MKSRNPEIDEGGRRSMTAFTSRKHQTRMKVAVWATGLVVSGFLFPGCSGTPVGVETSGDFQITQERSPRPTDRVDYVRATVAGRTVALSGILPTSACGRIVAPTFLQAKEKLTVSVYLSTGSDTTRCPAWVSVTEYVATFRDVLPGRYSVEILFDIPGLESVVSVTSDSLVSVR